MKQPRLLVLLRQALVARRYVSKVWVFNNMPAGARVDTKVSCPLPRHLTTRGILLAIKPATK